MRRAYGSLWTAGLVLGGLLALTGFFAPNPAPAVELTGTPTGPDRLYPERPYLPPPWVGMRVGMDVLVDGRPVTPVWHRGRAYLPVQRLGVEYELRIWNHGPRRVTAVVSVDGLSVIHGRPAAESDPGYVIAPRSQVVIKGWRRDRNTVAAFRFETRERSYAYRMGQPENIGVIGLVAFEEQWAWPRPYLRGEDRAAPSAKGTSREVGSTGTGYCRDRDSPIIYVPFIRSANWRTATFYYDTVEALRRAGVPVDQVRPGPFPVESEFVPPPPRTKGGK